MKVSTDSGLNLTSSRVIVLLANTENFLATYKIGVTKKLIELCQKVIWVYPGAINSKVSNLSNRHVEVKLECTRSGIIAIQHYFFYCLKLFVNSQENIHLVSHTVYPNIASMLAYLIVCWKRGHLSIFVSGFGPSRIRNSLKIRLLARGYISLLRYIAEKDNCTIYTLNSHDFNIVQDFKFTRRCLLVRESGVEELDVDLGQRVITKKTSSRVNGRDLNVLYFGRMLLEKGIHEFIEVANICKTLRLPCNFIITGSCDGDNSSSIVVDSRIQDTGLIEVRGVEAYEKSFMDADILLFTSHREGHPLYLLRSMAFGVVPIVYGTAGTDVDVIDGYNGLISPSKSPTGLSSLIYRLVNNREELDRLSLNACEYASTKTQLEADSALAEMLTNY
jgi:glycosyltransferase involved in cell wall biosynthesis